MKLQGFRLLSFVVLLFAVLYACTKSDSAGSGGGHKAEFVRATISGRITDDNQMPVSGATIKVVTSTATTDADGRFSIKDVYVDKNATLVKAEKAGYFLGTRTIMLDADQNTPVSIQLIRKMKAGTFSGAGSGSITVPGSGGTIDFAANSVVNPADNKPYTGNVSVSAFFINPAADNFREIMPGTLRGINTNNQETGLQSFGMMAVELNGDNGEKLQIAPGQKATLHFPITESLRAEAPATIPLWSLDETTGLWKEEGTATRQGDEYVGTVSHFSFWNCDAPFATINFTATVKDQQGKAIAGAEVVITASNNATNTSGSGITSAEGVVKGAIPGNRTMQLKVLDKCGNVLYTKEIGPFATNTDLGVITINATSAPLTVSGTVASCNNAPLTNGYVLLDLEGLFYNIPVSNGSFSTTILRCQNTPTTCKVTAYDIGNNASGGTVNVSVTGSTLNTGQLSACGTALDAYIDYTLNGISYHIAPPADSIAFFPLNPNNNGGAIGAFRNKDTSDFQFMTWFTSITGPGTYKLPLVYIAHKNVGAWEQVTDQSMSITFTEYGTTPGSYISGAFNSIVKDTTPNSTIRLPVTCTFRVRRQ